MFECRACVHRAIRAIGGDVVNATRPLALTPRLTTIPHRRFFATEYKSEHDDALAAEAVQHDHTRTKDAIRPGDGSKYAPNNSARPKKEVALSVSEAKALRKEVEWLKDPLKFAEHVHYTLRCEKPDKALELCRIASKDENVIVAWNHLINWHVQNRKYNKAVDIFNEMKKRGQFPDSYTYMLLFRSFPQTRTHHDNDTVRQMVPKAIKIYNTMTNPDSKVKPNIMHTNAVLRLCSLARDTDAMWSMASQIPEHGAGAADLKTYSTLIGGIRHAAQNPGVELSPEEYDRNRQQAVNEGRRIWQEVITKWRNAEIQIDESLVVEMANLLHYSKRMEDWDDVLSLVQQTCNITRLIATIGSPDRKTDHVPSQGEIPESIEDSEGWVESPANNSFKPVTVPARDPQHPRRPTSLAWVKPGNGILNVLVNACTSMRIPKAAQAYWDLLTTEYGIVPDGANFHAMLKLLQVNRSSKKAAEVVQTMHASGLEPRNMTYRIAMSVCQRDWKNINVMRNATALIDDMQQHVPYPDALALEMYLSLALQTKDGKQIVAALNRLDPMVHLLRSRVTYGVDEEFGEKKEAVRKKEEALRFCKFMVGAMDTLMSQELVPQSEYAHWSARRSQLQAFVGKHINSIAQQRERVVRRSQEAVDLGEARKAFREKKLQKEEMEQRVGPRSRRVGVSGRDFAESLVKRKREDSKRDLPRSWGQRNGADHHQKSTPAFIPRPKGFADSPSELGME